MAGRPGIVQWRGERGERPAANGTKSSSPPQNGPAGHAAPSWVEGDHHPAFAGRIAGAAAACCWSTRAGLAGAHPPERRWGLRHRRAGAASPRRGQAPLLSRGTPRAPRAPSRTIEQRRPGRARRPEHGRPLALTVSARSRTESLATSPAPSFIDTADALSVLTCVGDRHRMSKVPRVRRPGAGGDGPWSTTCPVASLSCHWTGGLEDCGLPEDLGGRPMKPERRRMPPSVMGSVIHRSVSTVYCCARAGRVEGRRDVHRPRAVMHHRSSSAAREVALADAAWAVHTSCCSQPGNVVGDVGRGSAAQGDRDAVAVDDVFGRDTPSHALIWPSVAAVGRPRAITRAAFAFAAGVSGCFGRHPGPSSPGGLRPGPAPRERCSRPARCHRSRSRRSTGVPLASPRTHSHWVRATRRWRSPSVTVSRERLASPADGGTTSRRRRPTRRPRPGARSASGGSWWGCLAVVMAISSQRSTALTCSAPLRGGPQLVLRGPVVVVVVGVHVSSSRRAARAAECARWACVLTEPWLMPGVGDLSLGQVVPVPQRGDLALSFRRQQVQGGEKAGHADSG